MPRWLLGAIWILMIATAPSLASAEEIQRISTCFESFLSALRLAQLEQGIGHCDEVIADQATSAERRGEALAQRGLMHARQWAIMGTHAFAQQGIADITEALKLHTPAMPRRHQLLIIRAQLYVGTGQIRRARDDYAAILKEDPNDVEAKDGRDKIGAVEGY